MQEKNISPLFYIINYLCYFLTACDCNGLSSRCFFDQDLYEKTGHGGHCLDCQQDTAGPHCERCKDFFYRKGPKDRCKACNCNPIGKNYAIKFDFNTLNKSYNITSDMFHQLFCRIIPIGPQLKMTWNIEGFYECNMLV